jgi:methyl acetate hydrolase
MKHIRGGRHAQNLDVLLDEAVASGMVPGVAAAVTNRSGLMYSGAAGQARRDVPMSPDSIFRIASMTKLVTTVAIMTLVEDKRIGLDDPLADHLPGYRQPELLDFFDYRTGSYSTRALEAKITIRQLLSHTAGYGYWFLDRRLKMLTGDEPELFKPPFLVASPGTKFVYGVNTDVLGQIIQPLTGQPLAAYLRQRVLEPLGMVDTSFRLPEDQSRLTGVYERNGKSFIGQPLEQHGPEPRGGGGLYSTGRDYSALLRMLLNGGVHDGRRLLSAESVQAITSNQIGDLFAEQQRTAFLARSNDFIFMDGKQKFGFGVTIETEDRPSGRSKGSYGWAGVLNTYFWADPSRELAATLMMQLRPFADPASVELYRRFERAVYEAV